MSSPVHSARLGSARLNLHKNYGRIRMGKKCFLGEMTLSRREEIYNKRTGWCNATTCGAHAITVKKKIFSVIKMKETCKKQLKTRREKLKLKEIVCMS